MARTPPNDPEALAAILVGLRAFASRAQPANDFERAVVDSLQKSGAKASAAQKLVDNFDRLAPSVRARALGPFAGLTVPQRRQLAPGPTRPRGGIRVPRTFDVSGGSEILVGPSEVIDAGRPRGDGTPVAYQIRYVGFHCDEEVGDGGDFLFPTSDEVYAVTSAVHINADGTNDVRTEKHPFDRAEYSNVDAGDTRLGPVVACWQGTDQVLPMSLTVVAYERDFGDPDEYRDEIDAAVKTAIAVGGLILGAGATSIALLELLSGHITDLFNSIIDTEDDRVDIPRTTILTLAAIEAFGRRGRRRHMHVVKTPFGDELTIATELVSHFKSRHSGLGGRYTFGFDIERNPAFVEDQPDVD
jgi:hypothetical protein